MEGVVRLDVKDIKEAVCTWLAGKGYKVPMTKDKPILKINEPYSDEFAEVDDDFKIEVNVDMVENLPKRKPKAHGRPV